MSEREKIMPQLVSGSCGKAQCATIPYSHTQCKQRRERRHTNRSCSQHDAPEPFFLTSHESTSLAGMARTSREDINNNTAFVPLSQAEFPDFGIFVNYAKMLCKLNYVNFIYSACTVHILCPQQKSIQDFGKAFGIWLFSASSSQPLPFFFLCNLLFFPYCARRYFILSPHYVHLFAARLLPRFFFLKPTFA